jgi:hypothetical protein
VPLKNYETIINLISGTTTKTGLKIKANLDQKKYQKGIKVLEEDFEKISLKYHEKYPKWNYTVKYSKKT